MCVLWLACIPSCSFSLLTYRLHAQEGSWHSWPDLSLIDPPCSIVSLSLQWTETATGDRWSSGQDHQIWGQVGHARGRRTWRPRTVDTSGGCGAGQVTIDPLAGGRRGRARPVLIRPGLRAWQGHPGRPMPRARCRQARRAPSPASSGGGGGVPQFPGTVSQRHVKSRGESASGCSLRR